MKRKLIISMLMVCLLVVSSGCGNDEAEKKDDKKVSQVVKKDEEKKDKGKETVKNTAKDVKKENEVVKPKENKAASVQPKPAAKKQEQTSYKNTAPKKAAKKQPAKKASKPKAKPASAVDNETTEVTLFIGYTGDISNYRQVKARVMKPVTDERLIAALADETGWDLTLANPIRLVDDGRYIEFADTSVFASGPDGNVGGPAVQKDEYFCYDTFTLTDMILGSIQRTLDSNLLGNGRSMALYYSVMGRPIRVENREIPMDEPWINIYQTVFQ